MWEYCYLLLARHAEDTGTSAVRLGCSVEGYP